MRHYKQGLRLHSIKIETYWNVNEPMEENGMSLIND